jgi:protein-S-isoprenylcysteine O-methyltransferase Ste14
MEKLARLKTMLEGTKLYDFLAAAPLIAWYGFCGWQIVPALAGDFGVKSGAIDAVFVTGLLSQLASLSFVGVLLALLTLRHTPRAKTPGVFPRIAAIAGTYLGVGILLLPRLPLSAPLYLVSTCLILIGTGFALYAVLRLGRSISIMPEARRLVTAGPYRSIRHPLYLGEAVALTGLCLQYLSPAALLLLGLQFAFQLQRMKNEERVLARIFPEYGAYSARTARLVPGLY